MSPQLIQSKMYIFLILQQLSGEYSKLKGNFLQEDKMQLVLIWDNAWCYMEVHKSPLLNNLMISMASIWLLGSGRSSLLCKLHLFHPIIWLWHCQKINLLLFPRTFGFSKPKRSFGVINQQIFQEVYGRKSKTYKSLYSQNAFIYIKIKS